ncbi:MAG: antibiotic biosynthesis monooxygenase [Armatimonadota bacterium]
MYVVLVEFVIKPEHTAEFRPAMLANAKASLEKEPGCHRFDVCTDIQDAGKILLYELYSGRASFDAHLAAPHYLEFDTKTKPWVERKTVSFWELTE